MEELQIEYKNIDELIPYINNSRTHSDTQVGQIAGSIKEFGFANPILIDGENGIIAGHGRLLAAKKLGMKKVPVIELHGLDEIKKKAYIIADNKIALNSGWDNELLALELNDLLSNDFSLDILGFDKLDLDELLKTKDEEKSDNPYTTNVQAPVYEVTGEKPSIEELFDDEKAMDLIVSVKNSKLNEKEKQFLMAAASRHIVFDYAKIANFYAHSSKECQELMENSALVIIDFNKAIENGFVKITKEINDMFELEKTEEDE
jgi:hypothetical protein